MSGENESLERPVDRKVAKAEAALDDFERSIGLPPFGLGLPDTRGEAKSLLEMTPDRLRKMTAIECGESAFILEQFATHLQRALNRLQSRAKMADEAIRKLIRGKLKAQAGYSFEERRLQAIHGDAAAQEWETIRVQAQLKIERLSYLASKVNQQADRLGSLQFSKRKRGENE